MRRQPPLRSRQPLHSDEVERISVSLTKADKEAVEKIARDRRVSIAWVVREAIIQFLSDAGREQASTALKLKNRANS